MSNASANAASATRTVRLKVRTESYAWLNAAAIEVNQVFNYCNETSLLAATRTDLKRKWMSGFDLCSLSAGATEFFEKIGAGTIQSVCVHYAQKRRIAKRLKLRWRASRGARRSLGWVPFKAVSLRRKGNALRFCGKSFRVFEHERLDGVKWRDGCFAQDSCGDWWLCLPVEVQVEQTRAPCDSVGVDLGLKTIATTSDGEELEAGRWTHGIAERLAQVQRRGHKRQAKRLYRKAANRRRDALHKFSTALVQKYQRIYVGDVSSAKLVKTRMAKSVLDSGWGMLRTQLAYKSQQAAREFQVVDERNTTRVCSSCGCVSGPSGLRQLAVRAWRCEECGTSHDRDINSAINIRQSGLRCRASVRGNELSLQVAA